MAGELFLHAINASILAVVAGADGVGKVRMDKATR